MRKYILPDAQRDAESPVEVDIAARRWTLPRECTKNSTEHEARCLA
jgi:hypothetical protein